MAADCIDGDYLGAYSRFFAEFVARVNPHDQLPVKVCAYDVTENELLGEIISVTLQYLNQTYCPPSLQGHIVHLVIQEIKTMCKKQPEDCGLRHQEKTYAPLKLMQAIISKVNEICTRYLDNSRLALLPPPPSTPLPLVTADAIRNARKKMEDRYVVLHDLHTIFSIEDDSVANYYAVFDGHAGQDAAVYCATHLHQYLAESIHYPTDPERALRDAFLTTDAQFIEKSKTQKLSGGTTAVCVLLLNKKLYVAWVGDSMAYLVRRGYIKQLVNPHRPTRGDEIERIHDMGGVVMHCMGILRVNGVLGVSRAIGDVQCKPYVTGDPEIRCVPLDGTEDFIIIACDGLWDYVDHETAAKIVYKRVCQYPHDLKYVQQSLLQYAKVSGSQDNITVIVVFLTPPTEIAARPASAHPLLILPPPNGLLNIMDPNNPFLSNANGQFDVNAAFVKQQQQQQQQYDAKHDQQQQENGGKLDDNHIIYEASSNGKHENGSAVDDDYEEDLGPETDVDAVDDIGDACPSLEKLSRELFPDEKPRVASACTKNKFSRGEGRRVDDDEDEDEEEEEEEDDMRIRNDVRVADGSPSEEDDEEDEDEEDRGSRRTLEDDERMEEARVGSRAEEGKEKNQYMYDVLSSQMDEYPDSDGQEEYHRDSEGYAEEYRQREENPDGRYDDDDDNDSQVGEETGEEVGEEVRQVHMNDYVRMNEQDSEGAAEERPEEEEEKCRVIEGPDVDSEKDLRMEVDRVEERQVVDSEDETSERVDVFGHVEEDAARHVEKHVDVDIDVHMEEGREGDNDGYETESLVESYVGGTKVEGKIDSDVIRMDEEEDHLDDEGCMENVEESLETCVKGQDIRVEAEDAHAEEVHIEKEDAVETTSAPVFDTPADETVLNEDESPPSPQATKPLQHALIPDADNVADSEDSEDEWNYYRVDPNKEKDNGSATIEQPAEAVATVTEKEPVNRGENDLQNLNAVEEIKDLGSQPPIEKDIKCESPKEEILSKLIDTEISAEGKLSEAEEEASTLDDQRKERGDMEFQLNPDAAEFVPISSPIPGIGRLKIQDFPISGSPLKQPLAMDDIPVPSQREFEEEVCQRPSEIEEKENGEHAQPRAATEYIDFLMDKQKVGIPANLDESEISSTKAEFGDESAVSFLTATDFHRAEISTMDGSFADSEREYDISKDPMAMSINLEFEGAFDKGVDLNAVHNLSGAELTEENGTFEEEGAVLTAQSPEHHEPELNTLITPESEQPAHTVAFPDAELSELVQISQPRTEAESILTESEDAIEERGTEFVEIESERQSSPIDQTEEEHVLEESDRSPLTDSCPSEVEPEKEKASIEQQSLLDVVEDITEPVAEGSEATTALLDLQQTGTKDENTPTSISPVPDTMESTSPQPAETAETAEVDLISSAVEESGEISSASAASATPIVSNLRPDVEEFKPGHAYDPYPIDSPPVTKDNVEVMKNPLDLNVEAVHVVQSVEPDPVKEVEPVAKDQKENLGTDVSVDIRPESPVEKFEQLEKMDDLTSSPLPEKTEEQVIPEPVELACPLEPSKKVEEEITKLEVEEQQLVKDDICKLESSKPETKPEAKPVDDATINLSESMQEFTGLERQLEPEAPVIAPVQETIIPTVESIEPEVPKEETPKETPKEILEQKEPERELIVLTPVEVPNEKEAAEVEEVKETEEPESQKTIEVAEEAVEAKKEKPVVEIAAAAVAAVAATAATATVAATASKSKAKPTATKTTKPATTAKSTPKSTPTSPCKSVGTTTKTSTSSATKKPAAGTAARPKQLDASNKTATSSSPASRVTASRTTTAAPKSATTATTKPPMRTIAAAKPKPATGASPKPAEKKPTTNGDVKSLNKSAAAKTASKPASTTANSASKTSTLVKTSTTTRTSTGAATKPRPASAAAPSKPVKSSSATTTSTSTASAARPKTAPVSNNLVKSRVSSSTKSPVIDKQTKESANKQISSMARTSVSTTKTSRTSTSATSTTTSTVKRTSITKSSTAASPTKKASAVTSKVTSRTSTGTKSSATSKTTVGTATKVVQNGVSESTEITNAIISNSKVEDDVPQKDLSPVVVLTDNQLIMTAD